MENYPVEYGQPYFEHVDSNEGLNKLRFNTCGLIDFQLLVLPKGQTHTLLTEGREFALTPLTGSATFSVNGKPFGLLGGRDSVFTALPESMYSGCDSQVDILAETDVEIAIGSSKASKGNEAYAIRRDENILGVWGEGNHTRHYRSILHKDSPSETLWLAEVVVRDGCWATFPPHKHEDVPGDAFQEEMYFYKVEPKNGFGFCALFGGEVKADYAFMVRNNTIHKMPFGYHTVTAAPGQQVYYYAIFAGRGKEHRASLHPDFQDFKKNPMPEPLI